MSYSYSSLILDAERAKQQLVRPFQSGPERRADSPSPPTKSAPVASDQKEAGKRPNLAKNTTPPNGSGWTKCDMSTFGLSLTLLLLGTIAAANTNHPVFWLLIGPAPLAAGFTVLTVFRKRFSRHPRNEERISAASRTDRKLTVPTDGPS